MPVAPTTGEVATIEDQMPYAPPGVSEPTRFMPFLQNLDFSGLPRYEDIRDIRGVEDITPTLFDIDVEEILKDIDTEKFEDIDLSGIDIPSVAPMMPTTPIVQEPTTPVMPQVPVMPEPVIPEPVIPEPVIPEPVIQQPPVRQEVPFVPEIPSIPMNFTGLPQMPVIPNIPVMPELPVVPQPIQPMNFTRLSNLPVSNFAQPNVREIIDPIKVGRAKPIQLPQPGLFSLV